MAEVKTADIIAAMPPEAAAAAALKPVECSATTTTTTTTTSNLSSALLEAQKRQLQGFCATLYMHTKGASSSTVPIPKITPNEKKEIEAHSAVAKKAEDLAKTAYPEILEAFFGLYLTNRFDCAECGHVLKRWMVARPAANEAIQNLADLLLDCGKNPKVEGAHLMSLIVKGMMHTVAMMALFASPTLSVVDGDYCLCTVVPKEPEEDMLTLTSPKMCSGLLRAAAAATSGCFAMASKNVYIDHTCIFSQMLAAVVLHFTNEPENRTYINEPEFVDSLLLNNRVGLHETFFGKMREAVVHEYEAWRNDGIEYQKGLSQALEQDANKRIWDLSARLTTVDATLNKAQLDLANAQANSDFQKTRIIELEKQLAACASSSSAAAAVAPMSDSARFAPVVKKPRRETHPLPATLGWAASFQEALNKLQKDVPDVYGVIAGLAKTEEVIKLTNEVMAKELRGYSDALLTGGTPLRLYRERLCAMRDFAHGLLIAVADAYPIPGSVRELRRHYNAMANCCSSSINY